MKRNMDALPESPEFQSVILDTLPANIAIIDKSGYIIKTNESWKTFGEQNGMPVNFNWLGKNYIAVAEQASGHDEITVKRIAAGLRDVLQGNAERFAIEYPCHSADEKRWFIAQARRLDLLNDVAVVVMHIDITQRKLAEEKQANLNSELEIKVRQRTLELTRLLEREKEVNELKARFVTMASHEFRTPLATMLSSLYLLEGFSKKGQHDKSIKHFERVRSCIGNIDSLLQDFLTFNQIESGHVNLNGEAFDLRNFLETLIEEDKVLLKKGQNIHLDYNGEVGVVQDKKVLRNVVRNLLSNAIKYSDQGKTIYLLVEVHKGIVEIQVKDEGIGIPEKDQQNIFNLFFRAGNVTNIQGTGLGLSIVKRYMEILGGDVSFKSTYNRETTFTLQLPQNLQLQPA